MFFQYYETARWIAQNLSMEFPEETIGIYAGGTKSGIFINGEFTYKDKETIKARVKDRDIRVLVGTDAASEGLNLQTLGSLINIDLPWNPTRLEQRKGRIQRIGQEYDTIYIYNMRYKDSIEDKVHKRLSERLRHISDVFGQVPDTLEDV
ncbi:helicase-related protein, partial [Clostridium sp. Cult1]|uniref:helicase-related protein n=1 Tax=Clostridium sp. Cult1 TaxID=2079002 RepID=UPI003013BF68